MPPKSTKTKSPSFLTETRGRKPKLAGAARTDIYIEQGEMDKLDALAALRGVKRSEILRKAISEFLAQDSIRLELAEVRDILRDNGS